MTTISIAELKARHGNATTIRILTNPKTGRNFGLFCDNGIPRDTKDPNADAVVRCQHSDNGFNIADPLVVLVDDEGKECIINENNNVLGEF